MITTSVSELAQVNEALDLERIRINERKNLALQRIQLNASETAKEIKSQWKATKSILKEDLDEVNRMFAIAQSNKQKMVKTALPKVQALRNSQNVIFQIPELSQMLQETTSQITERVTSMVQQYDSEMNTWLQRMIPMVQETIRVLHEECETLETNNILMSEAAEKLAVANDQKQKTIAELYSKIRTCNPGIRNSNPDLEEQKEKLLDSIKSVEESISRKQGILDALKYPLDQLPHIPELEDYQKRLEEAKRQKLISQASLLPDIDLQDPWFIPALSIIAFRDQKLTFDDPRFTEQYEKWFSGPVKRREALPFTSFDRSVEFCVDNILPFLSTKDVFVKHMSWIEGHLIRKITARELVSANWTKEDKEVLAPNICKLTKHFNMISSAIISSVLTGETPETRSEIISRWISIGHLAFQSMNYQLVFEVIGALTNPCILTLKRSWGLLGDEILEKFRVINDLTSPFKRFKRYNDALETSDVSLTIPYIGPMLTTIVYIEEGNSDKVQLVDGGEKLWNVSKFRSVAQQIERIICPWGTRIPLIINKELVKYMHKCIIANQMEEEELMEVSRKWKLQEASSG